MLTRGNGAQTGSINLILHGLFPSKDSVTITASVRSTTCEATLWISGTSIACKLSDGTFGSRRLSLSVGSTIRSATTLFSVDVAFTSTVAHQNSAATGSTSLTLYGASLSSKDLSPKVLLGVSGCQRSMWVGDSSILCKSSHGVFRSQYSALSVLSRVGSVSSAFSLSSSQTSSEIRSNIISTGSLLATVFGSHFGFLASDKARLGRTAAENTAWASDTVVLCLCAQVVSRSNG